MKKKEKSGQFSMLDDAANMYQEEAWWEGNQN
jgi:hypothetical protein